MGDGAFREKSWDEEQQKRAFVAPFSHEEGATSRKIKERRSEGRYRGASPLPGSTPSATEGMRATAGAPSSPAPPDCPDAALASEGMVVGAGVGSCVRDGVGPWADPEEGPLSLQEATDPEAVPRAESDPDHPPSLAENPEPWTGPEPELEAREAMGPR